MWEILKKLKPAVVVFLLALIAISYASEAFALNLLILFRDDMALHNKVVQQLHRHLAANRHFKVREVPIRFFSDTYVKNTDLVLALGDAALAAAMKDGLKGIFVLVTDSRLAERAFSTGRWQGVMARPSYEIQLRVIRRVMPDILSIGVIYGPEAEHEMNLLQKAASELGIEIKAKKILDASEALHGVRGLFDICHAIFMFPDPKLLNNITMESMLLLQYEKKIPVVGISKTSVSAGALLAVSYDLEMLPETVANVLMQYEITGAIPDEKAFESAVTVYHNIAVAKRLGVQLNMSEVALKAVVLQENRF